ncbi:MAG TPA: hypothetical protein VFG04_06330 [Planctomycetaceae bacterium]|nr:hypothetical protein [Planctomycetaceae bacterium]
MSVQTRRIVFRGWLLTVLWAATGVRVHAQQAAPAPVARTDDAVAKALAAKIDIDVRNVPLEDFVKDLAKRHGISFLLDRSGLRRAKVSPSTPITASFKQIPLGVALRQILRPLKLQHRVADGTVIIDDLGLALDDARPGIARFGEALVRRRPAVRMAQPPQIVNMRFNGQAPLQQLRLVLQVELGFVKSLCRPTAEQMRTIKQEALKQIADLAKDMQRANNLQIMNRARQTIQEKLSELVHAQLSPAQSARYDSEIQKRSDNLRQACARNLVVAFDEHLSLTEWQRQKLSAELAHNWDDSWTIAVALGAGQMVDMLPNVPDELVVPYLDATQRTLWNNLPKRTTVFWGVDMSAFLGIGPPLLGDQE